MNGDGLSAEETQRAKGLLGRINQGEFYAARVKVAQVLKPKTHPMLQCRLINDFKLPGRTVPAGRLIAVGPEMFTPNQRWKPLAEDLSSTVHLPTFQQCEDARNAGNATPLETFIYDHCPAPESAERKFFDDLKRTIEFCIEKRLRGERTD